ncbi:flagellar hook-basal body protein [Schnuerera sp.]|uniref:flagellar hook-basal body protein n=1 Tax=Schnuerera sp. TaxID=2794844 RepID=UPI002B684322|nr:flagellar hook-basal body protein [Schnuerera sp.]HSH35342.1 flagellar hook-basal body protein [Schnuerera sp.]
MNRGLYINATSLATNQKKLEVLTNNLANVNTAGFKKDMSLTETFPEKLLAKINGQRSRPRLRGENQIEYETNGQVHRASTSNGYFVVQTPMGNSYVKDIRFIIDDEGYLRTFYQDNTDEYKTDYENYVTDNQGNPIQGAGENIEDLSQGIVYYPPSHVVGTMSAGLKFQKNVTDFTQGNISETGGTYDLALNASGFFKVADEEGNIYYTRDGSFTINQDGMLTTSTGEPLQGIDGNIYIEGNQVSIDTDGGVIVDGDIIGFLDIVDLENREFLRKIGDNQYQMAEGVEAEEVPYEGEVLQGYLESSNVNAIQEMVEMITLLREYEAGQKAIRAQDEMLEKASNEIGRI